MKLLQALRLNENFPYHKMLSRSQLYCNATVDSLKHTWILSDDGHYQLEFLGLRPSRAFSVPVNAMRCVYGHYDGFEPALRDWLDLLKDLLYTVQYSSFNITIGSLYCSLDIVRRHYVVKYECLDLPLMRLDGDKSHGLAPVHKFYDGLDLAAARVIFRKVCKELFMNVM